MRILVITPTFLPALGGAELVVLQIYRRLACNHSVLVLTPYLSKKILENKKKVTLHVSELNLFNHVDTYSIYPPYFTYPFYKENKSTIRLNNKSAHASQTLSKLFWDKYYKDK